MIALDKVIGIIFYSNIFIAGSAVALHWSLCKMLGCISTFELEFVIFTIVLNFYNICQFYGIKGKDKKEMSPLQLFVANNMTELIFFLFFMDIISFYFFFTLGSQINGFLLLLLILMGAFYLILNKPIQNAPYLKPFYIAICWVMFIFMPIKHDLNKLLFESALLIGNSILLLCFLYDQKDKDKHLFQLVSNPIKYSIVLFLTGIMQYISTQIANTTVLSTHAFITLGTFLLLSLIGINRKKEMWHLTITDGQMYLIACLLCSLK